MPLVIKGKRIAVGLFKCSLAEDGTMFVLSYFCTYHHRQQRAFQTSIMQNLYSKTFLHSEICVRSSSNQL